MDYYKKRAYSYRKDRLGFVKDSAKIADLKDCDLKLKTAMVPGHVMIL